MFNEIPYQIKVSLFLMDIDKIMPKLYMKFMNRISVTELSNKK